MTPCTGPHVPANAISYRLGVIRKEGAALGLQLGSGSGSVSTPAKTKELAIRTKPAAKKIVAKGKGCVVKEKGRKRGLVSDDERRVACSYPIYTLAKFSSDDADVDVDNKSDEEDENEEEDEEESATESDTESDDYEETSKTPARPAKRQKITEGDVKKRVSPRKTKKTKSKRNPHGLTGPVDADGHYMDSDGNLVDSDGDLISGDSSSSESEEGLFNDGEKGSEDESDEEIKPDPSWTPPDYDNIEFYKMEDDVFDPALEWHLPEGYVEPRD